MRAKVKAGIAGAAVVAATLGIAGPGAAWQKVVHPLYTDGVAIVAQAVPGPAGWDGPDGGCTTSWGCPV